MKLVIFSFVIFFSTSHLCAQVKTGGGGAYVVPAIESEGSSSAEDAQWTKMNSLLSQLTNELKKIESNCTKKTSFSEKYNFIDSFYSLSLKKSGEKLDEECVLDKKVSDCLDSENLKKIMKEINATPTPVLFKHLEAEYKLDKITGSFMMKFFTRPIK